MNRQLLIVSNRLPFTIEKTGESYRIQMSTGGLVTALDSVLRKRSGVWVGWPGVDSQEAVHHLVNLASLERSYRLKAVRLTDEEIDRFYLGFSNEIISPLFHDLPSRCNFAPEYWDSYRTVNQRFAESAAGMANDDDFVWIHDYHFTLVGKYIRERNPRCGIGFFQHIPFPPADIFAKLPWRLEILSGMLQHDVTGFQTDRDRNNFLGCVKMLLPHADIATRGAQTHVHLAGRCSRIGVFPISIDFREFAETAGRETVANRAREMQVELNGSQIILGVDRLDYTKGIVERLRGFRHLLRRSRDLHRRITLVQVVVPSRADIPKYHELKQEIDRLIGEINGEFSDSAWVPIHYLYRHLSREDLVAYYRAADVALVTPLKDGMNLVAKEYCASQVEHNGVLVLSEFAGAAAHLGSGALLVNPNDQDAIAGTLFRALRMPLAERRNRMLRLRTHLRENDVYGWAESFLEAGTKQHVHPCQNFTLEAGHAAAAK